MSVAIEVSTTNDIIYWQTVFQILGIKRCQMLLRHSGVPAGMSAKPEGLVRAAMHFWSVLWDGIRWQGVRVDQGYSNIGFPEDYLLGIQFLLMNVFRMLGESYDETDTQVLYEWARRNFIDQDQVGLWFIWSLLLNCFETVSETGESPSDAFSAVSKEKITKVVKMHFGSEARRHDAQLIGESEKIPLSPVERKMIALEVTRPTDFVEVNISEVLQLLLARQHAYVTWTDLDSRLDDSERESLLWWAYAEAPHLGMPTQDIRLPERSRKVE